MSDPEGFLQRWSRRKRAAAEPAPPAVSDATVPEAPEPAPVEAPAFDPETLPSLDSITADTDIRAFLAPGVPAELTRAALRRAWAADPQIRDFIGLAENQWDFTAPEGLHGFGQLGVEEARRLAAEIMEAVAPPAGPVDTALVPEKAALPAPTAAAPGALGSGQGDDPINPDANAPQVAPNAHPIGAAASPLEPTLDVGEVSEEPTKSMLRRTHGRALPE